MFRKSRLLWLAATVTLAAGMIPIGGVATAATTDQSVALGIDAAHDGWIPGVQYGLPASHRWTDTFGTNVSFPLVTDLGVFVIAAPAGATNSSVYALDPGTGAVHWQHGLGSRGVGIAFDNGTVFAIDSQGVMSALDAATGNLDWATQLPDQYSFSTAPTAVGGTVYVGGSGMGGTLYALNESTGALEWSQDVANGDTSTPAVDAGNVYVTYPGQYYAFNRTTGATVWHVSGDIEGGGGWTPVEADGHLLVRDEDTSSKILSTATGAVQGPLVATDMPAVAAGTAFELNGSTLDAVPSDGLGPTSWSFSGDGQLTTSPIVTGTTVWVGSATGMLYALDGASGQPLWSTNVGAAIDSSTEYGGPPADLAAGAGNILVPAGSELIDYGTGEGAAAPSGGGSPSSGSATPTPTGQSSTQGTGTPSGSATTASPATTPPPATTSASERTVAGKAEQTFLVEFAPRADVHTLLARRAILLAVHAPAAGRVLLRWFDRPRGHTRGVLIGQGTLSFGRAQTRSLTLRLTPAGRRVLRAVRGGMTLQAYAALRPLTGRTMVLSARLRLRP